MDIAKLIAALAQASVASDATNQYANDGSPGNAIRRANLSNALQQAITFKPTLLIIGEAPGYLGARRTGIPFTSERLLLGGIDPPGLFGVQRGFALATDDGIISAEQTATIVWREIQTLGISIVGWNAFPFHPHRLNQPRSNRTPRAGEIRQGHPFLTCFCQIFPDISIVAMGNVADRALTMAGIAHHKVRHPAQGGARLFATGLRAIIDRHCH